MKPSAIRHFEHSMLGALLLGALFSPVVAVMTGWMGPTLLGVPLRVLFTTLLGVAAAVVSLRLRHQAENPMATMVVSVGIIAATAIPITFILPRSADAFNTAPSLMTGMAGLLALHVVSRVMRWIAVRRREDYLVVWPEADTAPPTRRRDPLGPTPQRSRAQRVTLPAVALADGLASVSAWTLLVFWMLVASEHRHYASGILVFASILLALECVILIPDTLAGWGMLPRGFEPEEMSEPRAHLELMRG